MNAEKKVTKPTIKKKSTENTTSAYPALIDGRFVGPLGGSWGGCFSNDLDIPEQIMGEQMREGCLGVLGSKVVAYSGILSHGSQIVT